MAEIWLDFERPIIELERKIEELKSLDENGALKEEISKLENKTSKLREDVYKNLTRWQKVQLARHLKRPYISDYIELMFDNFVELHGDRNFGDDLAIIAGIAKLDGKSVVIVGHEKGRNTKEKIRRNFGMPHPEGYRKALRVMQLAAKFKKPILTFVDTPGAYPGVGAEERGQSEAIARNLREISMLPVPIVVSITGEGGSGGALAIAIGDKILMQEHSIYSVISPEGCASILWRDSSKAPEAAEALKLTAQDLMGFGVIDEIVSEPAGGAHRDSKDAAERLKRAILNSLNELTTLPKEELVRKRIEKFLKMGVYENR